MGYEHNEGVVQLAERHRREKHLKARQTAADSSTRSVRAEETSVYVELTLSGSERSSSKQPDGGDMQRSHCGIKHGHQTQTQTEMRMRRYQQIGVTWPHGETRLI